MRTKFKWCYSTCKKVSLTIKTVNDATRFIDEKGYEKWFDLLYPLIKSRDSCQPVKPSEPSAEDDNASLRNNLSKKTMKVLVAVSLRIARVPPTSVCLFLSRPTAVNCKSLELLNSSKVQLKMIQQKNIHRL